jgi:membrane fusion protein (multidrug efflux system)
MAKRMIVMLLVMLVLVGGIFAFRFYQFAQAGKAAAAQKPPPVTVSAEAAREDTWSPKLRTTGSVAAVQGVDLSNELAGVVEAIKFESGDVVEKGTLLVQLNVDVDVAQLRSAEASAELARQNFERARRLRESNVNAQAELDVAKAQHDQALANVESAKATIAKKSIVAPFRGRLGLRQVNLGQYLASGTLIVSLQSLDPVYVNFALPQQDVRKVQAGQEVAFTLDAFPGAVFPGRITAFDSRLDDATRTVRVQATLANAERQLQPGMFGSVAVMLPQQEKVITVPQSAITYNPYGNVVYVITPDASGALIVRQQFVKLGDTRGDQVAVVSGLKPGEQIVTSGQLKLRDGVTVQINNQVPPSNQAQPTPPNA